MKTNPIIAVILFSVLILAAGLCHAGIPEPDTVIHGDVYNTSGGKRIPVTGGRIDWVIKGREGAAAQYNLTTAIECFDCENWSDGACVECNDHGYILSVPQEAMAAGAEAAEAAVPLTGENQQYDYLAVTVDGTPAKILLMGQYGNTRPDEPAGEFLLASQNRRSHYYRVDLEMTEAPADEDSDGMPDYWETENGLLPADPADAPLDPDGDGWSNLQEFLNNADPNGDNRIPMLYSDVVRTSERGMSQFQVKILDSDTPPESVRVEVTAIPESLALIVFGEASAGPHGAPLAIGDVMTLQDMIEGNILLVCRGEPVDPAIGITLSDGEHEPVETEVAVTVFRPTDAADPLLWVDAAHFAAGLADGGVPTVMPDRSSHRNDGAAYRYTDDNRIEPYPLPVATDTFSGRPAVHLDGSAWIELPSGENVFPGNDAMFITMFRATGETDGILASGPYFEVAVTGSDHPSHPNEIRVSTDTETVYGNRPVLGEWVIAMVSRLYGQTRIVTHGVWGGGPWAHPIVRNLGTDPTLGARAELVWDFDLNDWIFNTHNRFEGDVGEIIMYNRQLDPTKGWRVGAYLQAKWFAGVVNDQSDATSNQDLMSVSWFEWKERKDLVDAANDARAAYEAALVANQGVQEALAAFEALVPDHAPWTGTPPAIDEAAAAFTAYRDATLFDYERDFVALYGRETPYVMLGGFGDDNAAGGHESDVLLGGPGADRLWGLGGADLFVVGDGDEVYDFNRSDGDRIDLTGLLYDPTRPLSACVRLELVADPSTGETHTLMRIDSNGDGSGFDDAEILLRSVVLRDTDLPVLWANGHLQTGGVRPQLSLSIEADTAEAMEIGGSPGVLKLTFSGPVVSADVTVPADLTVPLTFGGDAEFGVDYRLEAMVYDPETGVYAPVPMDSGRAPVVLKPGDKVLTLHLIPMADGVNELVETARVGLMPKSGHYGLGEPSAVDIRLSDGPDEVRIAATGPAAHESGQLTGRVSLSRTGTVEDPLEVRLSIQGTAINGTDYEFIPSEVQIPAGQVTVTFPVSARTDAETEPEEYAEIFVVQGDGYIVAGPTSVRVAILDVTAPLTPAIGDADGDGLPDEWERQYGLDPAAANAGGDPDNDGFTNLEEYLCGTNPVDAASTPAPPLADAGPNQVAAPGAPVKLSAFNSLAGNGEALSVSWTQIGGPAVDMADAQSPGPSFTAPGGFTGALTFEAIVTSPCGGSATDACIVNVTPDGMIPAAAATAAPALLTGAGETAALDGSGSTNIDGTTDGLSYRWAQVQGPDAVLSDPTAASPNFAAPVAGAALVFELTVTDDATGLKDQVRVAVNVSPTGQPPEATASAAPNPAKEGATAALTAEGGTAWQWRQVSGTPATLSDPMARTPELSAPAVGPEGATLDFELAAMNGEGLLTLAETALMVTDDPAANAGMVPMTLPSGDRLDLTADGLVSMTAASADGAPDGLLYDPVEMDVKVLDADGAARVSVRLPEAAPDGYVWYARTADGWQALSAGQTTWSADGTSAALTLTGGAPGNGPGVTRYAIGIGPAPVGGDGEGDGDSDGGSGGGGGCFINAVGIGWR